MPIAKYKEGTQTVGWGMALESVLIWGKGAGQRYRQWRGRSGKASAGLLNDCRPGLSNDNRWVEYGANANF